MDSFEIDSDSDMNIDIDIDLNIMNSNDYDLNFATFKNINGYYLNFAKFKNINGYLNFAKFKNINGITCYMNSILHILQQIICFTNYVFNSNKENDTITHSLCELFKLSINTDKNKIICPVDFKCIIGKFRDMWNDNNQQDSSEFLIFLLEAIRNDCKKKYKYIPNISNNYIHHNNKNMISCLENIITLTNWNKFNESENPIIKNMFYSVLQTLKICCNCKHTSITTDTQLLLTLNISTENNRLLTIYDYLDLSFNDEIINADCHFCNKKMTDKISKSKLWKTPEILIIYLCRLNLNEKINYNILYPIENLNLSKYFNENSIYKTQCNYNLIGINLHKSIGFSNNRDFGHYVSIIKNSYDSNWYLYNDEHEVMKIEINQLQHPEAYILFYKLSN